MILKHRLVSGAFAAALGCVATAASAGPAIPGCMLPDVFSVRITDVGRDCNGSVPLDNFRFMLEMLNWTNTNATEVKIWLNSATTAQVPAQGLGFTSVLRDNGRPFGNARDLTNYASVPTSNCPAGSPPPASAFPCPNNPIPLLNTWSITAPSENSWIARRTAPSASFLGAIDISAGCGTASAQQVACNALPGGCCGQSAVAASFEALDNGPNSMDGFVMAVDNWPSNTIVSFNWLLLAPNSSGVITDPAQVIQKPNFSGPHPYSYGTFTITRGTSYGAIFRGSAPPNSLQSFVQAPPACPGAFGGRESGLFAGTTSVEEFESILSPGILAPSVDGTPLQTVLADTNINPSDLATLENHTVAPLAECGNGTVDPGESCDPSVAGHPPNCTGACVLGPRCGDGNPLLDPGEQCDDGNAVSGDGCSGSCLLESLALCGNGLLDPGEQCDDGNHTPGDGCSPTCAVELPPGVPFAPPGARSGLAAGLILLGLAFLVKRRPVVLS